MELEIVLAIPASNVWKIEENNIAAQVLRFKNFQARAADYLIFQALSNTNTFCWIHKLSRLSTTYTPSIAIKGWEIYFWTFLFILRCGQIQRWMNMHGCYKSFWQCQLVYFIHFKLELLLMQIPALKNENYFYLQKPTLSKLNYLISWIPTAH